MNNINLLKKVSKVLCLALLSFLPFSLMGQCPVSVTDVSAGAGSSYDFEVPGCPSGFPAGPVSTDGGGMFFLGGCNPGPPALQNYGGAPDPLPAIFQFGGVIGDCPYDAAGNLIAAAPQVPTLSEWGLFILALFFMIMGTLYLINDKVIAARK